MLEVFEILLPIGILIGCAYAIGYMSGCEETKNIYNHTTLNLLRLVLVRIITKF